jgi:glycerol uptake facilitator protein
MSPYVAEFIGTALLVLFGDGVVANVLLAKSKGQGGGWIVITTGWALAAMVGVYSVSAVSGGHLNPAVTIGLAAIGKFEWAKVGGYIVAQMAGAMNADQYAAEMRGQLAAWRASLKRGTCAMR